MMKRIYISAISATLLLMLFSCNKKESVLPLLLEDEELIAFSPAIAGDGEDTKGSMVTGTSYDYAVLGPFWVKAYTAGTTLLFDYTKVMQFTHSSGTQHTYWSTVDADDALKEYYWKKTGSAIDNMYFFAYTNLPASGVIFEEGKTYEYVHYDLTGIGTAGSQKDILIGTYSGQGSTKSGYVGRFADITFRHPLVAVRFKKGTIDGWQEGDKITDIKISEAYLTGRYKSVTDASLCVWENLSSSATVSMSDASGLAIDSDDMVGETFFLMPQNLATKNITVSATLILDGVTYTDVNCTLTAGEWKAGNYYTYTLDFGTGNPLDLHVNLADWGEIGKNIDMEDGSVLTYSDPSVDAWDDEDSGNISYSD